jgi:hypothetical protein
MFAELTQPAAACLVAYNRVLIVWSGQNQQSAGQAEKTFF